MNADTTENPASKKRGPNTPEGKARSAMNALKHRLRAERFALLPEETIEAFEAYTVGAREDLRPGDARELALVEAIVVAEWRGMIRWKPTSCPTSPRTAVIACAARISSTIPSTALRS